MRAKTTFERVGDVQLALAVRASENGALECLVERYQNALFGFALRLLCNEFDAEDVVQDTVIRVHRAFSRYDEDKIKSIAIRPWLFRIARNLAFNRLRSRRRHDIASDDDLKSLPARDGAPDTLNGGAELLQAALAGMDASERELLELRFFQELPYAEIAMITGGSDAALRGRVHRALRKLRTKLERLGYTRCDAKI